MRLERKSRSPPIVVTSDVVTSDVVTSDLTTRPHLNTVETVRVIPEESPTSSTEGSMVSQLRSRRHSRFGPILAMVVAAIALMACSNDDKTTEPASIAGTYTLQSVNGTLLPVANPASEGGGSAVSGQITLTGSGTYSGSVTFVGNAFGTSFAFSGTYVRSGNTLAMHDSGGDNDTATIDGSKLTYVESEGDHDVLVFVKSSS
jgi:uncharacterized lipoprotein NlpE involved in copper resistance